MIVYVTKNSRPGVRKVGVVITDGKSSEPGYTEIEAKRAHVDGVNVYTIGSYNDSYKTK